MNGTLDAEIPSIDAMSSQAAGPALTETPSFEKPATTETPVKETPKEVAKDAPKEAPKTEAKPATKEAPKAPEAKKDQPKDDSLGDDYQNTTEYKLANSKLRKTVDRFAKERNEWKTKASEFETSSKTSAEKIAEYEKKIKDIESKPVETKADAKLVEKYENEIKSLKQTVREYDYQKSDEFKEKYSVPFERAYKKAVGEVTQLSVLKGDNTVAATEQDFAHIRSLPLGARRAEARRLFGEDSDIVLSHASRLEELRDAAREAIAVEKENHEVRAKESEIKAQKERDEYANFLKQSEKEILETVEGFKFSDDPEEKKAWEKGLAFVEHALNNVSSLPANERAAHAAAVKMKAALYDLNEMRIKSFNAKLKSMTDELEKLRGSDPGAGGEKGEATPVDDDVPDSIEAMLNNAPAGWARK